MNCRNRGGSGRDGRQALEYGECESQRARTYGDLIFIPYPQKIRPNIFVSLPVQSPT